MWRSVPVGEATPRCSCSSWCRPVLVPPAVSRLKADPALLVWRLAPDLPWLVPRDLACIDRQLLARPSSCRPPPGYVVGVLLRLLVVVRSVPVGMLEEVLAILPSVLVGVIRRGVLFGKVVARLPVRPPRASALLWALPVCRPYRSHLPPAPHTNCVVCPPAPATSRSCAACAVPVKSPPAGSPPDPSDFRTGPSLNLGSPTLVVLMPLPRGTPPLAEGEAPPVTGVASFQAGVANAWTDLERQSLQFLPMEMWSGRRGLRLLLQIAAMLRPLLASSPVPGRM